MTNCPRCSTRSRRSPQRPSCTTCSSRPARSPTSSTWKGARTPTWRWIITCAGATPPATLRIKSGVAKDGRITARQCEVWWNGGAFADVGPRVTQKSGFSAAGPYDIDNVHIDSYALYTNLPPAGALRGFGIPQLCWAYESHTDMLARALKLDPIEFRRRNILRDGRPQATGTLVHGTPLDKIRDRLAS